MRRNELKFVLQINAVDQLSKTIPIDTGRRHRMSSVGFETNFL